MGKKIKEFRNGSFLEYDRGAFDDWCVYLTESNGRRRPPRDIDYFEELSNLADKYGAEKIYRDYVSIYELTMHDLDNYVLDKITSIASTYVFDSLQVDIIFSILYMAMISEERKENTKLGKRIKRLGIYELLIENRNVRDAANFMRGMGWRQIDVLCRERGF